MKLVDDKFDGYNALIRPVQNLTEKVRVEVQLALIQIIDVVRCSVLLCKEFIRSWYVQRVYMVSARHSKGPPFSAIFSSDNLRLRIRLGLGLGLGLVVWLWQYQELFHATTTNDGFQNGGPFGMVDRNRGYRSFGWYCCKDDCEYLPN